MEAAARVFLAQGALVLLRLVLRELTTVRQAALLAPPEATYPYKAEVAVEQVPRILQPLPQGVLLSSVQAVEVVVAVRPRL